MLAKLNHLYDNTPKKRTERILLKNTCKNMIGEYKTTVMNKKLGME